MKRGEVFRAGNACLNMASEKPSGSAAKQQIRAMSNEQIIAGFQEMRNQQRGVASKISELEMEKKEHDLVIDALREVDGSRKCFRMVGGVLVERTVKEVLPKLEHNLEQLQQVVERLTKQLEEKGKELNEYREKHNLRVRGEDDHDPSEESTGRTSSSGVLVAKDAT